MGSTDVRLAFAFDTDADDKTVDKLTQLTERFCVIYQTLKNPPSVTVETRTVPGVD